MSWFIDNIRFFQFLLAMVALGFGAAFYLTKRVKFLGFAGLAIAGIVLLWFLPNWFITDQRRLDLNVREMADAVVAGNQEKLLSHLAQDFDYHGINRAEAARGAVDAAKRYGISDLRIWDWTLESLDVSKGAATASFLVRAEDKPFRCQVGFVREHDRWKLREVRLLNPLVNQDTEIQIPIR